MSGISPFYGQVDTMFEQIVHGKYDFPEEQFSHVSAFGLFIYAILAFHNILNFPVSKIIHFNIIAS